VDFVCRNPDIHAISFVGSDIAVAKVNEIVWKMSHFQGKYIYEEGSKHGKRVQSNMGAKNHGVVLPDANRKQTLRSFFVLVSTEIETVQNLFQITAAAFGAAGQRCMALSTAVFVVFFVIFS
jgi:malonate-semialdehyde dehydrogenase (acetylating)/methylmalonate-semialdehyde dehydrogenase